MASISFRSAALGLAALACAACQGGPPAAEAAGLAVRLAPAGRTLQGVDALAGLARVSFALDRIERPGEASP